VLFGGLDSLLAGLEPAGQGLLEGDSEFAVTDTLALAAAFDLVEAITDPRIGC